MPTNLQPLLGDTSRALRIVDERLAGDSLTLVADVPTAQPAAIDIATDWTILSATNATVESLTPQLKRITFHPPANSPILDHTQRVETNIKLKR
jgi:hypothetical protein